MSERFIIVIESVRHSVPVDVRVRRLLKIGLRYLGLRVVDVQAVDETNENPVGKKSTGYYPNPKGDNHESF